MTTKCFGLLNNPRLFTSSILAQYFHYFWANFLRHINLRNLSRKNIGIAVANYRQGSATIYLKFSALLKTTVC